MMHCMEKTDAQTSVSQMFNTISPAYDFVNRVLSFGIDSRWRKRVNQHLPDRSDLEVIDLATGTCDQILSLMNSQKIAAAVGIDLAEEMLQKGRQKIAKSPFHSQIELKLASALDIPEEDASFDCATMSFGIRNVQGNCLAEILRVLRPGGKALILEFSTPKNRFIRFFHFLYLRKILPSIGGLISKEKSAYRYLNQTIEAFPSGEDFLSLMREAGFTNAVAYPMTFGVATLYVGEKSDPVGNS